LSYDLVHDGGKVCVVLVVEDFFREVGADLTQKQEFTFKSPLVVKERSLEKREEV
jgi:hypothetical protein